MTNSWLDFAEGVEEREKKQRNVSCARQQPVRKRERVKTNVTDRVAISPTFWPFPLVRRQVNTALTLKLFS
jgi:hypothetical protein